MPRDARGHALTIASDAAARAVDHAMDGFLRYRVDAGARLGAAIALDPDAPLPRAMDGLFAMLGFDRAMLPRAEAALARAAAVPATPREAAHVAALRALVAGRVDAALATWEAILDDHPRDILAFRLHHFHAFWTGEAGRMLATVERLLPHWSDDVPGWGTMLACRCFANEEAGHYAVAERAGRAAVARDPGELWATHGVAHVLEMGGRRDEGLAWLAAGEPHWAGGNNLTHHLWWHAALFHVERREFGAVLDLYDRRFRDHGAALTAAMPDLYIDVQNAASMLWRLERHGVAVGDRWTELADKAETRIGDTLSAFTQPHWMMALAAAGRDAAAARLLDALDAAARGAEPGTASRGDGPHAVTLRDAALPACRAVLLHRQGRHAEAVAALRPALGALHRLGGSHAQRDVLEQLFLDAAMRAGLRDDVRLALDRAARNPTPPARRIGTAAAARDVALWDGAQ